MPIMEYYIYTTKHCNLSCSYCDGVDLIRNAKSDGSGPKDIKGIMNFVKADILSRNSKDNYIVLYGGEPLLNQSCIKELISFSHELPLEFVLHTNGTLLSDIYEEILERIKYIIISIDGNKEKHDFHRGEGTYSSIMGNIKSINNNFKGDIISRLTVTPGLSLVESVIEASRHFKHVFWQIENNHMLFDGMDEFKEDYRRDVNELVGWWLNELEHGRESNIIPFQTVTESIIYKKVHGELRCGASGRSLVYVDTDGKCYVCDKLIGNSEFCVGDIKRGISHDTKFSHTEFKEECVICNEKYLCGGRCLVGLLFYPKKKFDFYCDTTRILIEAIRKICPRVEELIVGGIIRSSHIINPTSKLTEQIP